jgi:hypothetical protein
MDSSSLPYSTSKKDQPVRIRLGDGLAADEPLTIVQQFDNIVAEFGDKPALHQKMLAKVSNELQYDLLKHANDAV